MFNWIRNQGLRERLREFALIGCALVVSLVWLAPKTADAAAAEDSSPANNWVFAPGKIDLHHGQDRELTSGERSINSIFWSQLIKGGYGFSDLKSGDVHYGGIFATTPNSLEQQYGRFSVLSNFADQNEVTRYEVQSEYITPLGFGAGGGLLRSEGNTDLWYTKLLYRGEVQSFQIQAEIQFQRMAELGENLPGGYLAIYNDTLTLAGGTDGEQWRVGVALTAPTGSFDRLRGFRPSAEVLFVDKGLGSLPGPRVVFANASLGYKGGFLSNAARMGRFMGPQGMAQGNPLGFVSPTFNRRLNTWELGGLADFRIDYRDFPDGQVYSKLEALIYPAQFLPEASIFDAIFVGGVGEWGERSAESAGVNSGFLWRYGALQLALNVEYLVAASDVEFTGGVIWWF